MAEHGKTLAIIAARGGSKGLPNKNILDCAGKPLIAWTIEAALQSQHVDCVFVSTDSQAIADVAVQNGAWVPFLRSSGLADDKSSVIDVIKDVVARLKEQSHEFDYVLLLQPTSPLRTAQQIDQAVEKYFSEKTDDADTLISVKKIDSKFLWMLGEEGSSGYLFNHCHVDLNDNSRRQSLPECYIPNGAIYLAKIDGFNGFYGKQTRAYVMDDLSSMDIDYQEDLDRAARNLAEGTKSK